MSNAPDSRASEAVRLYGDGRSQRAVAAIVHTSPSTVRGWLRTAGVAARPGAETRRIVAERACDACATPFKPSWDNQTRCPDCSIARSYTTCPECGGRMLKDSVRCQGCYKPRPPGTGKPATLTAAKQCSCGREFQPTSNSQKYCSETCAVAARRQQRSDVSERSVTRRSREPIWLADAEGRYLAGESYREIATAVGSTHGTVRHWLVSSAVPSRPDAREEQFAAHIHALAADADPERQLDDFSRPIVEW